MLNKFKSFAKMLTFRHKETSILGQRKYGIAKSCQLSNKSVLGSRKYSGKEI